ncbi:MAG TPA: acyl-ACP desaturase [Acidimicrobiales bacterium]
MTADPEYGPNPAFDEGFLAELASCADAELARHLDVRVDWSYHDILDREAVARRSAAPPVDVSADVQAIFLGNLAVEKGHAEYDRIVGERFERHPSFRAWKNSWVAEEEPHSAAMLEWAKVSGLFARSTADGIDLARVHGTIAGFIRHGLTLSFDDAGMALAYPAFQEPATRVTHLEVKKRLPDDEVEGRKVLSRVIGDEERHERFYCNMVRHALWSGDRALASHQMCGIARSALGFTMPGIETDLPGGDEITKAYKRTGAFTVAKVAGEVLRPLISGVGTHRWDIEHVEDLDDRGRAAQAAILAFDRDLQAVEGNERRTLLTLAKARASLLAAA